MWMATTLRNIPRWLTTCIIMEKSQHEERKSKRSEVWKHFRVDGNDESKAICIHCQRSFSRGRSKHTYNTTNMSRHMQACLVLQRSRPPSQRSESPTDPTSSSSSTARGMQPSRQTSMTSFLPASKAEYGRNHPRQIEITRKIGLMIALDLRPFNMVDNVGFRDLVKALDPRYRIPSRPVFSENVIPNLYEEVKRRLKADITKTVGGISFTTDMWRSGQHKEYMCVTLHWIVCDEQKHEMQQRSALVSIEEFPEAASAENIRRRLEKVFREWCGESGRGKDCVIIFGVSDNGANVKKALLDAADAKQIFGWVSCFAHNLNLTVHHAVKTQRKIIDGLTILRKVVSKVLNSTPIKRRFEELQKLHYPERRQHAQLHPDVETRWNSVLTMLESILPQRLAIEALVQDRIMQPHRDIVLPQVFDYWTDVCDIMEELVKILRPFQEATLLCSQDISTLSAYVPTSKGLSVSVTRAPAEGVGSTKDLLLEKWNDVTADRILRESNNHVYFAATLLDPRYKKKFVPRERLERVMAAVIEAAVFMSNEPPTDDEIGRPNEEGDLSLSDTQQYPVDDTQSGDPVSDFSEDESHDDDVAVERQASLMASIVAAATDDDDDGTGAHAQLLSVRERVTAELTRYMNEPAIDTTASIQAVLNYWLHNVQSFPILSRIAMSYLACPMSSVTSERMFSLAGNILTKKRCAMKPENLNRLAVIKVNHHYLE